MTLSGSRLLLSPPKSTSQVGEGGEKHTFFWLFSKYSQHHNLRRGLPISLLSCADLVLMVSAVNVSILLMSPRARLLARPPLQYLYGSLRACSTLKFGNSCLVENFNDRAK